jgi:hypothetical protein
LPYVRQINVAAPGTGVAGLPFNAGRTASVAEYGSGLTSNFNSLQANLTKRLSRGVSFSGAYTFGYARDYGTNLWNSFDRRANYGFADWDRRHMLTLSHVFEIPFGTGTQRWNTGLLGNILAGWQLNGVFRWATGSPYTVMADPLACACPGVPAVTADVTGAFDINEQASFDPALFTTPAAGTTGNLGRNSIRGPDFTVYNISLFKSFAAGEQAKIELRGEVYNLLDTVTYGNPMATLGSANFGQPVLRGFGLNQFGFGRQFLIGTRILF